MITTKKLLIVDMDGTLFDTTERYNICQKISENKRKFWECFLSSTYMYLDKPRQEVINFVKSLIDNETIVVIVSGRSKEKQYKETLKQLEQIGLKPAELYLREHGDFRKDYEYKSSIISQLIDKYQPVAVTLIDDSDEVLRFVKEKLPSVVVIDAKTIS